MSDTEKETTAHNILWDFRVEGAWWGNGQCRVRITETKTGQVRERVGYNPVWELLRLFAEGDEEYFVAPLLTDATPPTQEGKP